MSKILVPSYIYPGNAWEPIVQAGKKVNDVIINPYNGSADAIDQNYVDQVKKCKDACQKVLGYVYTSYAKRSVHEVITDIEKYRNWYHVDGIFLDEGSNNPDDVAYYRYIYDYLAGSLTDVINFGTDASEAFVNTCDMLVTFESSYANYVNWIPNSWYKKYPAYIFYHIVHTTPQANMPNALELSRLRNAESIYITDTGYNELPTYWNEEVALV